MNSNEDNNLYHEDNSFNNQGVVDAPDTSMPVQQNNFPSANRKNMATDFAKGLAQGVKAGMNKNNPGLGMPGQKNKNNPATGQKKPNNSSLNKNNNDKNKKDGQNNNAGNNKNSNDKNGNNKRNPLPGGGTNKKDDRRDKIPKKNNKNEAIKQAAKAHPAGRVASVASKLGLGKKKEKKSESKGTVGNALKEVGKQGIKKIWTILPIQAKIAVLAIVPALFLLFLIFAAIFGATTAATVSSICDNTSYGSTTGTPSDVSSFMCSMQDPLNGNYRVSSIYGWRSFNTKRMHRGIDLAGPVGTDIVSVYDGEVVEVVKNGVSYGNYLTIKHSDNIYTRYAHLSVISVTKGQLVKKGEKIAERGNTGQSTGPHLHFEIRTSLNYEDTVSPNPFFGYSDQGYESCLDSSKGYQSGCDQGDNPARYVGEEGFNQICGRTSNYTSSSNSDCCETDNQGDSTNIREFIQTFEGSGDYCDSAKTEYRAYKTDDDRVTIGYGVTDDYLSELTSAGQCISVEKVDAAMDKAIDAKRNSVIKPIFIGVNLETYQEDALTSMAYNGCGTYFLGIAKAAAEGDYEKVWNAMKGCINKGTIFESGLKIRRKAEFALYVTGDYSVASEYKTQQKRWTDSEYDDYDSEGVIAKKATGTSSTCSVASGDKKAVVERAIQELEHWNSSSDHCADKSKYMKSCGLSGCNWAWCAGFVHYILSEVGVAEQIKLEKSCKASLMTTAEGVEMHDSGGSYVPQPGDIITFDWSGKKQNYKHVGIVEYVEGKTVHTIEGNSSDKVRRKTYQLDSKYIYKYFSY